jgi:hypothetical protein
LAVSGKKSPICVMRRTSFDLYAARRDRVLGHITPLLAGARSSSSAERRWAPPKRGKRLAAPPPARAADPTSMVADSKAAVWWWGAGSPSRTIAAPYLGAALTSHGAALFALPRDRPRLVGGPGPFGPGPAGSYFRQQVGRHSRELRPRQGADEALKRSFETKLRNKAPGVSTGGFLKIFGFLYLTRRSQPPPMASSVFSALRFAPVRRASYARRACALPCRSVFGPLLPLEPAAAENVTHPY